MGLPGGDCGSKPAMTVRDEQRQSSGSGEFFLLGDHYQNKSEWEPVRTKVTILTQAFKLYINNQSGVT